MSTARFVLATAAFALVCGGALAADENNLRDALAVRPADATADLRLMLDLLPGRSGQSVTDPYYGRDDGFASTWDDVEAIASALVARFAPSG